ncbi:MAG: hypothetical protein KBD36_06620 [Alphaproteobacteria bacterium]|jgi:hypothetical protein|nr:hypothetical protein [Alphaproteobacteria bacterium]MBP9777492.1 hypothetical protein [Alphaproteobacteria bacterium]
MKLVIMMATILMIGQSVCAAGLSSCHSSCFELKQACNSNKGHTYNSCDHDLFTCKASCVSGKKQEVYRTNLPIDISFQPILDF